MSRILSIAGVVMGASFGISISFLLEVVGAVGAVWGGSQALGLRNEDNEEAFRRAAIVVGGAALVYHVAGHIKKFRHYPNSSGFFQGFVDAVDNPYGAIRSQFRPATKHELGRIVIN